MALATASAQGVVIVGIDPMTQTVDNDAEFLVTVYVDSGQQPIDGVQVSLAFDPVFLNVVELTPGDELPERFPPPDWLPDGYSNSLGQIAFAAGTLAPKPPSGQFAVLTVRFHAEALTTGTLIEFLDDPYLPMTKVTHGGINLPANLIPGLVEIALDEEPTPTPYPLTFWIPLIAN